MSHQSVLLIGGSGFLGTALAGYLVSRGWVVHVLSRSLTVAPSGKSIYVHQGAIDDRALLEKVLPECETVVHLASDTTPGISAGKPLMETEKNILPTLKFLEVFKNVGHHRLVFVSSGGTLYGNAKKMAVNEHQLLSPLSYHGAGKVAIEAFLQAFMNDSGKKVSILRPSNIYGPGQDLRQGFGFIRTVLGHLMMDTEMEIWGDGTIIRDFLYIEDMVKCIQKLISSDPGPDVYNVGYGKGYALNDVIKIAEDICGKKLRVKYVPARRLDVEKVVLDCRKIRKDLGWIPETDLKTGIALTWKWMLQN